jgi:hypothetical protein
MPTTVSKDPLVYITNFVAAGFPPMPTTYTISERSARGALITQLQNLVSDAKAQHSTIDTTAFDQAATTATNDLNLPTAYSSIDADTTKLYAEALKLVAAAGGASHIIPIHVISPSPSPVGSSGGTVTSTSSTTTPASNTSAIVVGVVAVGAIATLLYMMNQKKVA